MVFYPPSCTPDLPGIPPSDCTIEQFVTNEKWRPVSLKEARPPLSDAHGRSRHSSLQVLERIDFLARGFGRLLDWRPDDGDDWRKVMGIFALNTPDFLTACFAVHRLGGICSPANAAYSVDELAYQLKDVGAVALCTSGSLLLVALDAAQRVGIPLARIFLFESEASLSVTSEGRRFATLESVIQLGQRLSKIKSIQLANGEGSEKVAFVCYSSGTSGLPKGVMVSHRNILANLLQITSNESQWRSSLQAASGKPTYSEVILDTLPQSHIYGLVYICLLAFFRGDEVVVLPRFDFAEMLRAIQQRRIETLPLVPPIIASIAKSADELAAYDLSSVKYIITGAAPLGAETASLLHSVYPSWVIRQGYGLTETATVVSSSMPQDIWFGSSGMLIPGFAARLVADDGTDISSCGTPGELLLKSPSVVMGYLNNQKANQDTFDGEWLRTGDIAEFRVSPRGNEHLWIVDRKKELIKVKGNQVAPAELEALLHSHPDVKDCAVIGVIVGDADERPKAFVVSAAGTISSSLSDELHQLVQKHKARYKWLAGGIQFLDEIPRSPSGKILRRVLRDKHVQTSNNVAKL